MVEVKRNLIQVRLTDSQLKEFNNVKRALHANNNADAIRELINDKELTSGTTQDVLHDISTQYNDLTAKIGALMWDSRNLTSNMNQIAHAANIAKDTDPSNADTWNWIVNQLQKMFPVVEKLSNSTSATNAWLKESRGSRGRSSV
ncbi:hypothetical protein DN444_08200 [Lactobacillus reuteri]|uniref:hypothetical protein n=1 Tax=Limosilactobacillus reuteri TaxID=1598 RepID=UPI00128BB471|nr:hypothetical protein [Limosilactobacillus reuteri]MQB89878.1 hypothetical protein [Limosilactobacillus reuteri]